MFRTKKIFFCALMLSLISVACKSKTSDIESNDLPDLSKQSRPYVTLESTTLRAGPGDQFRSIAKIPLKSRVHVVGRDGEWLLVVSKKGNPPGFIRLGSAEPGDGRELQEFEEPRAVEGRFETLADTQLRSGPGLHYPVVTKIAKGTKVNVVDEAKGWLKVESKQGRDPGYIEARLARPADNGR